jgi:Tol biopolymer transport system component
MPAEGTRRASRGLIFALIAGLCTLVAVGYVAFAMVRSSEEPAGDPGAQVLDRPDAGPSATVVFQHVRRDAGYAHVAVAQEAQPDSRRITQLTCERVHYAGERGLCLNPVQGLLGPQFDAIIFGPDFKPRDKVRVTGIITRTRVSPDGRYGAATGFVTGHSYADADQFSTQTKLIDMARGKVIADLEQFAVMRDGAPVRPRDRNFWGVTFASASNRFYATMQTGGERYLVEGDVARRTVEVIHANVECPSLSPDETRIAYKHRLGKSGEWRLSVLDLETKRETALAERQSVDDQAEWLDDDTVLYGLNAAVWSVPADGSGTPRRLVADALSPAVIR